MSLTDQINYFFGVKPSSFKRRLTIGSIAMVIVVVSLIVTIAGANITYGSKSFINSFVSSIAGVQQTALSQEQPYSITRVVYFMGIISVAFFLSIIYFIILPWQTFEQKKEEYLEEGLHKYY
jgi:hypothetical protein